MDIQKSFLSDETELPDLINEELSDSMSFCYGNVMSKGGRIWAGLLEFIDILAGRDRQVCLERICTTGLTPADYSS